MVRGEEVYVPASERAHMVGVLHMGHQSADTMIRNCKRRIFFPVKNVTCKKKPYKNVIK